MFQMESLRRPATYIDSGRRNAGKTESPEGFARRPGQDLGHLRTRMEAAFHNNFEGVRLHRDGLADSLGARAATVGDDIHLSPGDWDLSSSRGQLLVAHELAHVIHQRQLPGTQVRSTSLLEREADHAAAEAVAGRSARVASRPSAGPPAAQLKGKVAPPPPIGNILYVGMNNADPEIKALFSRYGPGSSVKVTAIKGTAEETATSISGVGTFDLTVDAGIDSLGKTLTADPAKQARLVTIFKSQGNENRDDLAHVAKVYSDTEADGKDRMTRVVLSGHSGGLGVFGSSGEIYFDALVQLAGVFPAAANQTRHLIVAGCHTGDESTILDLYLKAYPSLLTVWAWYGVCPTGPGAASAIDTWAGLTERGVKTIPKQGGGIATWSGGAYEGDPSAKAPVASVLSSIRADDARFGEYFDGTRADPSPHGGWLEAYYARVFAAARRVDVTGADHDEMEQKRQRALLLRFWKNVAKHYWVKNGPAITKGYGTATVPDFANLSRLDTLNAVTDFAKVSNASDPDQAPAAALLDALKRLDPKAVPDSMVAD